MKLYTIQAKTAKFNILESLFCDEKARFYGYNTNSENNFSNVVCRSFEKLGCGMSVWKKTK